VLLVRHGSAGDRTLWEGDDRERPLDERGLRQAAALVDLLSPYEVERILSSPARRCLQTVEPLAHAQEVAIEEHEELSEHLQATAGAELVRFLAGTGAVVCGHGGLEYALLDPPRWQKGAVLVVGEELEVLGKLRPKSS
jgi:phosphohistidine phosphatase SixA